MLKLQLNHVIKMGPRQTNEPTLVVTQPTPLVKWTHWGRVTHIYVSKLTTIGSDNGLSPGRRQAIIWTNAGISLIRQLGTKFSEISSEIHTFLFKKMQLKMSSGKWRPFCLGLNVLTAAITETRLQLHYHKDIVLWVWWRMWISL